MKQEPKDRSDVGDPQEIVDALMSELVRLRKKRGIGQGSVASAIGISQGRLSQIENQRGGVTLESVLMYARVIGADIVVVPDSDEERGKAG